MQNLSPFDTHNGETPEINVIPPVNLQNDALKIALGEIRVQNFRNYETSLFNFCNGINFISGLNGTGKTNLLEAVYYLCMGKGYFNSTDIYSIRRDESIFSIEGIFMQELNEDEVKVIYKNTEGKTLSRNQVKYQRIADHVGHYPVVVIEPDDTIVVAEGGEGRRKQFDNILSQADKLYLDDLIQYNKVLIQRNTLLKSMFETGDSKGLLEIYDKQLSSLAQPVHKRRREIVTEIKPFLNEMYYCVTGGKEDVSVEYMSDMNNGDLQELLKNSRGKDLALQRTSQGIHRDDYEFKIQNYSLKKYGSQGQKKSVMVALKMALYKWTIEKKGKYPLLLLDDIFDKLDEERINNLFNLISGHEFGQVFITDTNAERMRAHFHNHSKVVNFISLS